jgi:hypothetical protein
MNPYDGRLGSRAWQVSIANLSNVAFFLTLTSSSCFFTTRFFKHRSIASLAFSSLKDSMMVVAV